MKVDDLAGHTAEIEAVRKAIDKCGRPIVFSISPGGSSVARGEFVSTNANHVAHQRRFLGQLGRVVCAIRAC